MIETPNTTEATPAKSESEERYRDTDSLKGQFTMALLQASIESKRKPKQRQCCKAPDKASFHCNK